VSCMWCQHFSRPSTITQGLRGEDFLKAPGQCCLNPVPLEVSGAHCCSKIVLDLDWDGLSVIARWWLNSRRQTNQTEELKKEVKRLKVANRELRYKLKTLKPTQER
jgi:hypothetical protein